MKKILELHGDAQDILRIANLNKVYDFVWDFEQELRSRYKYGDDQNTTWDSVRELYYQMKQEADLADDLWY